MIKGRYGHSEKMEIDQRIYMDFLTKPEYTDSFRNYVMKNYTPVRSVRLTNRHTDQIISDSKQTSLNWNTLENIIKKDFQDTDRFPKRKDW